MTQLGGASPSCFLVLECDAIAESPTAVLDHEVTLSMKDRRRQVFAELGNMVADPDCQKIFYRREKEAFILFKLLMGIWVFSHIWKSSVYPQPFQPLENSLGSHYKKEKKKKKNLSACI